MGIGFAIGFSVVALILGTASVIVGAWALIEVQAFKRSTHQVQLIPADKVMDEVDAQADAVMKKAMQWEETNPSIPMMDETV